MNRQLRNWKEIQNAHDQGLTWRSIRNKFNLCYATITWAKKNGLLTLRGMSSANKLAWKIGTRNVEKYRTSEFRKKQSRFGGLKLRAGRCKSVLYTKKDGTQVWIQGSWEEKFALFLDSQNVNWTKNRVGYKYEYNGKNHLYFPDFHLPDFSFYVEVKGYETDKDRAKWKQFPFKLLVVKKQEIQDLASWWNSKMI